jgi:hypothetical protein
MTLASKLTGVLVVAVVFGALGIVLSIDLVRNRGHMRRVLPAFIGLFAAGVLALGIFYAVNPIWWGDPLARVHLVAATRLDFIQSQINAFDAYPDLGSQLGGFARQVIVGQPQFYEIASWEGYVGDQIRAYTASPWGGISLGASLPGLGVLAVLIVLGMWRVWRGGGETAGARWLVALYAAGITIALFIVTPLEWQRYYLPIIPAWCVIAGVGARVLKLSP